VFLAPDTFGHAGNLPQLASQAGATVYYHHRANPGFPSADRYWQAYWWVGDDGTRLLALATPVYLGPITATRLANDLIVLGKANGMTDICYFYGVGDHGGGPTREDLDAIRLLDRAAGFPLVRCATVSDYAAAVVDSGVALPEFHGESERVFEGCYITHADAKQLNRASENALVTAETLAAVAGIDAADELSTTWRSILHHQFHDILGGSAVAEAFDDQRRDTEEALASAKRITERALTILSGGSEPGTLVVTNPVAIDRRDLVRLPVRDRADVTTVTTAARVSLGPCARRREQIRRTDRLGAGSCGQFRRGHSLLARSRARRCRHSRRSVEQEHRRDAGGQRHDQPGEPQANASRSWPGSISSHP
jgi:alpha-mannosidase